MSEDGRLPDDLTLGPVHLTIADAGRSLAFYRDLLGLDLLAEAGGELWLGPPEVPLVVLHEHPEAVSKPARTTGLYHFALLVPDRPALGVALETLVAAQYPLQGAADHWVSEAIYLPDPDGNGIEIYRDRPRSEWTFDRGDLRMATEPLDADGVLAAAASGGPALPAGTVVGHVHLHVDELPSAEGFYREVIGFDLMTRYGANAAFLSAGGYHHHLGLNTWSGAGAARPPEGAVGLRWFTIVLPAASELGRLADRAQAAGIEHQLGPGWLEVSDPAGNRLRAELAANQELP